MFFKCMTPDLIATLITENPDSYNVYKWVYPPNNTGFGIAELDTNGYLLIKIPNPDDVNAKFLPLLHVGWPKELANIKANSLDEWGVVDASMDVMNLVARRRELSAGATSDSELKQPWELTLEEFLKEMRRIISSHDERTAHRMLADWTGVARSDSSRMPVSNEGLWVDFGHRASIDRALSAGEYVHDAVMSGYPREMARWRNMRRNTASARAEMQSETPRSEQGVDLDWSDDYLANMEDLNVLGPNEKQAAEHYGMSAQDIGQARFYAVSLNLPVSKLLSTTEGNISQLSNEVVESGFVRAVEIILKRHKQFAIDFITMLDDKHRMRMLLNASNHHKTNEFGVKAIEYSGIRGHLGPLIKMYLIANPGIPRPKNVRLDNINVVKLLNKIVANDRKFFTIVAQLSKQNGLGKTLAAMTTDMEHLRVDMLSEYISKHWKDYVGIE